VAASEVVLIRAETLPRTTSGKVRRRACRDAWLAGGLAELGRSVLGAAEPATDSIAGLTREELLALAPEDRRSVLVAALRQLAAAALRTAPERIDPRVPLGSLGLDSLAAAELHDALETAFGTAPDAVELLAGSDLEQIAGQTLAALSEPAEPAPPVLRHDGKGPVPASLEQERLWFLDQLRPGDPAANIPLLVHCEGPLDAGRLAGALAAVVARHESLRTCFGVADGRPVQVVQPPPTTPRGLPCADLSGLPEPRVEAEAARLAQEEALRPFDLARGPLLRASLVRLGSPGHRLLLTVHHAVCDLGSLLLVLEDLARALAGESGGTGALPEPSLRFSDFAVWQRQRLASGALEHHLSWWREQLAEPPDLELPADRPRSAGGRRAGGHLPFRIPAELEVGLRETAQSHGATLFMTLLATFGALLHRLSGDDDLVIGCPAAGRPRPELQELVGFFAYPLPLRLDLAGGPTFRELLARVRGRVLAALRHQEAPFARIVAAARRAGRSGRQAPPFRVMLSLLDRPLRSFDLPGGLAMTPVVPAPAASDFDLFLTLVRVDERLSGILQYDRNLYTEETARLFVESLLALAALAVADPDRRLDELPVAPVLAARAEAARGRSGVRTLAVAATFTAEPVAESLEFWMEELGLPARVRFAPYGQVFQALLDPAGLFARNRRGANVVLVRFEDWERADADELARALREAGGLHAVPCLVVICPPSPAVRADAARAALHAGLEERLAAALAGAPGVQLAVSGDLAALYPVAAADDPHADEAGRVPYTPELFAALGTLVARRLRALWSPPAKVLVLDCDQTLWKGVCAEDGPLGVEIDPPRRRLQEVALARHAAGMLLCLCSKNEEEDVREVFSRRPDMPLAWEHLAAWRVNWEAKSANLRALAAELRLGLDSFVVLDDDPVACAEMEAGCPEALVLRLPQDISELPAFLDHVWDFDVAPATAEDRKRAAFYRAETEREGLRREAPTLADFLAGLGLEVRFTGVADNPESLARAAQLTRRTNQWNATALRRTEGEVRDFLRQDGEGFLVGVRDRFGDYGQVGLALWRQTGATLAVDTLLLSCRALGRGVEHRMLARLGETALERGLATVEVPFRPTARNRPAAGFLNGTGAAWRVPAGEGLLYRYPAAVAAGLELRAEEAPTAPEISEAVDTAPRLPRLSRPGRFGSGPVTAAQVLAALRARRGEIAPGFPGLPGGSAAPRTPTEEKVAEIWRDLLGVREIGVDDHFFDLGGHSLLATQVISRVREAFGVEVPLAALFEEAPTVANLARAIARYQVEQADDAEIAAALAELDELSEEEIRALLVSEE
jgi:FkbH-like protein